MNTISTTLSIKEKIISFVWQHILLLLSLFVMTFGVALCVRSHLGSSVISTIPFVMAIAGESDMAPALTIGEYTYIMNFVLVFLQIAVLRRRFQPVQLFQLVIGFFFGFLLDVNMWLTSAIIPQTLVPQVITQLVGCCVLAVGISFEIRCGSVTMPGEGLPVAISRATGMLFSKAKIIVDISLVVIAVALGYLYFGSWQWQVVGPGTLVAMILVGAVVKILEPRLGWFSKVVCYRPGCRRYIYGLARYLHNKIS